MNQKKSLLEELIAIDSCILFCRLYTTNEINPGSEIVSLSIIDEEENIIFDSMIKPSNLAIWNEKVSQSNHINEDTVKDAPYIDDIREEVQSILDTADILVTYSSTENDTLLLSEGFDLPQLNLDVQKLCIPILKIPSQEQEKYKAPSLQESLLYFNLVSSLENSLEEAKKICNILNLIIEEEL